MGLKELGILDDLLPEPIGGAHADPVKAIETLKRALVDNIEYLSRLSSQERRDLRYQKFRQIGRFTSEVPA